MQLKTLERHSRSYSFMDKAENFSDYPHRTMKFKLREDIIKRFEHFVANAGERCCKLPFKILPRDLYVTLKTRLTIDQRVGII